MEIEEKKAIALSPKEIKNKIEHYCAYQERSQQEVRDKLYAYGLYQEDVENLICDLIAENFLNEERFAMTYAGGKFRMNQWGRIKITQGLRFKKVPEKLIAKALSSIDENDYENTLIALLAKKERYIKENDTYKRRTKLLKYAESKGFEKSLILNSLKVK